MTTAASVRPGREHIPNYPRGFIALRIVQLVVGIITLGLCAYGLSILAFVGDSIGIFTAIATCIVCVYLIVCEFGAPAIYNYWAVLSLDIFLVIFWLVSFAIMAAEVAPYYSSSSSSSGSSSYCYSGYCYNYKRYTYYYYYGNYTAFVACMAAVAGLGGLEFVLFLVSLVIGAIYLHRHRKAGFHSMPGTARTGPPPAAGTVTEKPPGMPVYAAQPQQPAPVYVAAAAPQQPVQYGQPMYGQPQMAPPQQQPGFYPPQQTASPLHAQATGGSYQTPPLHAQPTGGSYQQPQPMAHQHTGPPRQEMPAQQIQL